MQQVLFSDWGMLGYEEAWKQQEALLQENLQAKATFNTNNSYVNYNAALAPTRHHFVFVEHPPVYTLGKSGLMEHILISEEEMQQKNIQFFKTNRGGDITFHGPQQIVGYPILDLEKFYTDIGKYLRNLEEIVIRTLHDYGLKGERSPGETGVWINATIPGRERKICAMGVRCSRWITMHGFAFNINTDLSYFNYIIPCGIQNKKVTSLQQETGTTIALSEVKQKLKYYFEEIFDVSLTG
jgi:lipoyl(octanoyl) transferase